MVLENAAKEQGNDVGRMQRGKALQSTGDHWVKLEEAEVPCSIPEADLQELQLYRGMVSEMLASLWSWKDEPKGIAARKPPKYIGIAQLGGWTEHDKVLHR
ncbi:UNVERIFIED_CONTAM: hypothetical protein FKN15_063670 [Acipenser sinensis]